MSNIHDDSQCPELEMNKSFESPRQDHCREVRHVSEIPKTNSRKLCVIGTHMLIFKKQKNFENTPDAILNGKLTSLKAMKIIKGLSLYFLLNTTLI